MPHEEGESLFAGRSLILNWGVSPCAGPPFEHERTHTATVDWNFCARKRREPPCPAVVVHTFPESSKSRGVDLRTKPSSRVGWLH